MGAYRKDTPCKANLAECRSSSWNDRHKQGTNATLFEFDINDNAKKEITWNYWYMVHINQTYNDKLSIRDKNQSFLPTDLGCEYQFICQQQSRKSASWDSGKGMNIQITTRGETKLEPLLLYPQYSAFQCPLQKKAGHWRTVSSKAVCLNTAQFARLRILKTTACFHSVHTAKNKWFWEWATTLGLPLAEK